MPDPMGADKAFSWLVVALILAIVLPFVVALWRWVL